MGKKRDLNLQQSKPELARRPGSAVKGALGDRETTPESGERSVQGHVVRLASAGADGGVGPFLSRFLTLRCQLEGALQEQFGQLVERLQGALDAGQSCLRVGESERSLLMSSPLVSQGGKTPLVICEDRLYLHRYYLYEKRLAAQIRQLAAHRFAATDSDSAVAESGGNNAKLQFSDEQQRAAELALRSGLTIISGGPGTGKTTTVIQLLVRLLERKSHSLHVVMAAPTGKAAQRLSESVGQSLELFNLPEWLRERIPTKAMTLHRLLGVRRNSVQFVHHRRNPLVADVVVVDEASMVDLAMMSKLVDALAVGSRLILLGDKDQLASVESGAVLADFIRCLPLNSVILTKTYRFSGELKGFATAINAGDAEQAWNMLHSNDVKSVSLLEEENLPELMAERRGRLLAMANDRFSFASFVDDDVDQQLLAEIFQEYLSFQVLCAVRRGRYGVEGINRAVEMKLAARGYLCRPGNWYAGRVVLITSNDYGLELFNGDIGICLPGGPGGELTVWFERAGGGFRSFPTYLLPECETAYALTVHKSQGSEFREVVVVIPDQDNRVLCRELLYTAVTRAKENVRLVVSQPVLATMLGRNVERMSGLPQFLQRQGDQAD